MNHPNIFIEKGYWNEFELHAKTLNNYSVFEFDKVIQNRKKTVERIVELFRSSNIYTNDKIEDLDLHQNFGIDKDFKSVLFREIIKNNVFESARKLNLEKKLEDFDQSDFCFFTTENQNICLAKTEKEGRIHHSSNFLENNFFLNNSFPSEETNQDISKIDKLYHPCNSLVILDCYFFTDFAKKKKNFFDFLHKIIPQKIELQFELDIIVDNPQNSLLVSSIYNEILIEFSNKLSLHIYLPFKLKNKVSDRYILTNYSVITIGHPFDRNSHISSNFFPSNQNKEAVINSYNNLKERISFVKKIIDQTPDDFLSTRCKLKSDNSYHRIFK
jgi:hypothetical protein